MAEAKSSTSPTVSRQVVVAQIELLIDLLNALDGDPDLEPDPDDETGGDDEPSLGFSTGGFMPELHRQEGRASHANADAGRELEEEHDGCEPSEDLEPDVDDEANGGWANEGSQASPEWIGTGMGGAKATGQLA
jgi:hypothetical protein